MIRGGNLFTPGWSGCAIESIRDVDTPMMDIMLITIRLVIALPVKMAMASSTHLNLKMVPGTFSRFVLMPVERAMRS
jgi:hypothetical protein